MIRKTFRSIPFALYALSSTAFGTEPSLLEQIVVTGQRTELPQLYSPVPLTVITRADIEKSGALSIADVLRSHAGIQIRDTIGDGGRGVVVSMRGFGENAPNNSLILVDGRRLNNPTLQPPDLNSVALKDIERIEILQGGGGVLYGDQAVGGVINIITRTPQTSTFDIDAGLGSYHNRRGSVAASHRFDNGFGVRAGGERRESDNYRDNNQSSYTNLSGQIDYRWTKGRVFAESQQVDDQLELPGALSEDQVRDDRRQPQYAGSFDFADIETDVWRIGGRYTISSNWSTEIEITERNADGNGYTGGPPPDFFGAANTNELHVRSANPRLIGEFGTASGKAFLTLGYDATDSEYLLDIPDYFFRTDFHQEQRDGYAQLVYPLFTSLSASIGLRRSKVDDDNRGANTSNSDGKTISTASLTWQARSDLRVLLRRDEVLRYANVDENGYIVPAIDFLKPQTGESWETGVEFTRRNLDGKATLFQLDLDDEILYDPTAPGPSAEFGFPGANINLDSTQRRGLLLEGHWNVMDCLSFGASYTYTDAEITAGTFKGKDVPFVAAHTGSLSTNWDLGHGFGAYGELLYSGHRYAIGDDANAYPEVDTDTVLNLALNWKTDTWRASLRADNLLDVEYDTFTTDYSGYRNVYPAPQRALFLTVGYSL